MRALFNRLISAWQMVAKRGLAHWRLLSSVVLGVLLASAIMAGTVIYFDALRELALRHTLGKHSKEDLDILVKAERGPTNYEEYRKVSNAADFVINARIDWLLTDRIPAGKTATFFLTTPGNQELAGEDNARAYFAFLPWLEGPDQQHITIQPGGRFPEAVRLNSPDEPLELEAMIPVEAAELFQVGVGDRLVAVPHWTDTGPYVTAVISGVFQRNDPKHELWYLEQEVLEALTGPSFRTVPFILSEKSYMEVLGGALRRMDSTYAWLLLTDTGRVNAGNAAKTLAQLESMQGTMSATLSSYRQATALDDSLREYDRRLFFSKLPMFVVLILIAVVILYYVATLSSLVVEERRSEVALLRSRGASSSQILAIFVLEGATIAGLCVVVGPLIAASTISILGYTPAFSDLSGGSTLPVAISRGAYLMSALGGALSFIALMAPAVQASRIGVTRHRQQAARPTRMPAFQRYYFDVLLLVLSIFLFRQLTEQGSVVAVELFGELAVNQALLALPGLILVASAMVLLRLFPLAMALASRLSSSWLSAGPVMGIWQMARNPTHYARLSLLLILTAGLGIFASSFGATLERSFKERVLYSTGSDIRVSEVRPTFRRVDGGSRFRRRFVPTARSEMQESYEQVPGVDRATPVFRGRGQDLTKLFGESYTMLAVDGETFGQVAWLEREDFSDKPMAGLLKTLSVEDPPEGVQLPDDARSIGVRLKANRPHPTVRVTARIRNAQGRYSTYTLGTIETSDWTVMETDLGIGSRQSLLYSRPLTLVSLRVHEVGAARKLQSGAIVIDSILVRGNDGGSEIIEPFDDAEGWSLLKVSPDAISDVLRVSDIGFDGDSGSVLFSWTGGSPLTSRGIFHGKGRSPVPVLASKSFVKATGHFVGEQFDISVSGHRVPVLLQDTVELFPTMITPKQRFLIADLTSLTRYANLGATVRELLPNEVWLSTAADGPERGELVATLEEVDGYSARSVTDRAKGLADSKVDPLVEAGWRALLFIAFSAVLILSCLGFLVHAYVSFSNRQLQFALLRTIGFSMKQLTTMVWLEQTLVVAAGMALGTWMGGRLGATIMPFLGHDDWGGQVLPPFAMEVNWGALLLTYAAMVVVFGVISLGLIWFIQRIQLQRILRLGEM